MKILHYLRYVVKERGGVVRAVLDHSEIMARDNNIVTLITTVRKDIPKEWIDNNESSPRVVCLKDGIRYNCFIKQYYIRAIEKAISDVDIVYLHEIWRPEVQQLARMCRRLSKPYILPIYGNLTTWATRHKRVRKKIFFLLWGRTLLNRASALQCVNYVEKNQASRWAPNGNWVIAPYILDMTTYLEAPLSSSSMITESKTSMFLYLSRLNKKKGIELLIDAGHKLKKRGMSFKIIFAGSGNHKYEQQLRHKVNRLKLEDCMEFVGIKFGQEKHALYRDANALVLPTLDDNFGVVLIEAMGCGLPVITTNKVGIGESIEAAGAYIVDTNSTEIADVMERIIDKSDPTYEGRRVRSRDWVAKNFSKQTLLKIYEELHSDILQHVTNNGKDYSVNIM